MEALGPDREAAVGAVNDRWLRRDGERWTSTEIIRIQRRFRHHVRTPHNPRGRIYRERCAFAGRGKGECWAHVLTPEGVPVAEAHHVEYASPWKVVWLCTSHHRKVERKTVRLRKRDVWDYTSLIEPIGKPGLRVDAPF